MAVPHRKTRDFTAGKPALAGLFAGFARFGRFNLAREVGQPQPCQCKPPVFCCHFDYGSLLRPLLTEGCLTTVIIDRRGHAAAAPRFCRGNVTKINVVPVAAGNFCDIAVTWPPGSDNRGNSLAAVARPHAEPYQPYWKLAVQRDVPRSPSRGASSPIWARSSPPSGSDAAPKTLGSAIFNH